MSVKVGGTYKIKKDLLPWFSKGDIVEVLHTLGLGMAVDCRILKSENPKYVNKKYLIYDCYLEYVNKKRR